MLSMRPDRSQLMVFSFIASLADCPLLSSIVLLGKNFEGPLASLSLSSSFLHRPLVIDLNSLRELSIGSATVGSFSNTKQLDLDGLAWANHLETLILGDNLFSGDTLFKASIGRCDLFGGDIKEIEQSIKEKLFKLDDNITVYPGHGDKTTIGYEKKFNPYFGSNY